MQLDHSKEAIIFLLGRTPSRPMDGKVCERICGELRVVSTASELAACVKSYIPALFEAYSYDLLDALQPTLSSAVWRDHGVLFYPTEIPDRGPNEFVVIGDGNRVVRQNVEKEVTYCGDVIVNVSCGVAHVMDTASWVNVSNHAKADVHGHTRTNVYDQAQVSYHDFAKGAAYDNAVIHAHDYSLVDAGHDNVTLHAHDQSQFYVGLGQPEIFVDGSARGYIGVESIPTRPIVIHASGEGLLYVKGVQPEHIVVQTSHYVGTVIRGEDLSHAEGLAMDIVIPRFGNTTLEEAGILQPLELDVVKEELLPYLNGVGSSMKQEVLRASNEREICQLLAASMSTLITNGLTGDFLRRHFTEGALEDSLIHAYNRTEAERLNRSAAGTHHFFGSQLVHGDWYGGSVIGHERVAVIGDQRRNTIMLDQEACGITLNNGHITAYGQSKTLCLDDSSVQTNDQAMAQLQGHSRAWCYGQSHIHGYGRSYVDALDDAVVYLNDKCSATVNDRVRVLAEGENFIHAKGESVIGYAPFHPSVKVTVAKDSDHAKVIAFSNSKEYIDYRNSLDRRRQQDQAHRLKMI